MLDIAGIHHVSINVTDLGRARRFYSEVLGLEEIARPAFDFDGAWYRLGDRQLHLIVHPATHTLRGNDRDQLAGRSLRDRGAELRRGPGTTREGRCRVRRAAAGPDAVGPDLPG
jgi:catechol 2,3-dioxygenase-like lactoylglutathione lyase family enzyme